MPSLYSSLCEKLILPVADAFTRNCVMSSYAFFKQAQWWDRERLLALQDELLRETVATAYAEVPFYRDAFDACGAAPGGIAGLDDLRRLPVATKRGLKENYPQRCTRRTGRPFSEYFTSGSSGEPFAVRIDNYTLSRARALMFLRANFSGWRIGDPFAQTGMTLERGVIKRVKDALLRVEYLSAFDLSDQVLDRYLDLIDKKRLRYLMGYAGSLYCLASRAREVGFNRTLDGIVSWGDNLYEHYRSTVEGAFSCRVTDTYGCGEGIQIAAQCGAADGAYHVFMPHVIVEIVDDEGNPVPDGEVGNVLLTRLDPGAMPLIRYRVGDIARKSTKAACSCGRTWEMLAKIEGRDTDVVVTPRGNRLIVHFFTGIMEYFPAIETFRVVQERRGEITVEIVPAEGFSDRVWEEVKGEILAKGDRDLAVQLKLVSEIPLSASGKRRFVVSRVS